MAESYITQTWQEQYLEFISDPLDNRTQTQWCRDMKIDASTVTRWKQKHRTAIYNEADRRRKATLAEIRQTNWKNLMGRATKDTKAIELVFKLLGDLVEKSETTHNYMNINEKKTRLTELIAKAKAKEQAIEKFKVETPNSGVPNENPSGE